MIRNFFIRKRIKAFILRRRIHALYEQKEYLEAYREHTNIRVGIDPQSAVGGTGRWDEIGQLQYQFLISRGLLPNHKLLDIGCGTLRGGIHFIRYLEANKYFGIDISDKAIEYGKQLVLNENLQSKQPHLFINQNGDLRFGQFIGQVFDFLFAQSVFTHLLPDHIEECFAHIGSIMHPRSKFFFTFNSGSAFEQSGLKDFAYPLTYFQSLTDQTGLVLRDYSSHYPHPSGQKMMMVMKRD